MNQYEIEVIFRFGITRWSDKERHICIPCNAEMVREACAPVDWPTLDAAPTIREFICTPPARIMVRMEKRRALAELIAAVVRAKVLQEFCRNDTLMGDKPDGA